MDYDYRSFSGKAYEAQNPMYRHSTSSAPSSHPMYPPPPPPSSLYPKIGQSGVSTTARPYPNHPPPAPAPTSQGLGIRVTIKPEHRITPPPQLSPHVGDIPRSNFSFDFEFERKILAEAEKDSQNWVKFGMENLPSRNVPSTSSTGPVADPIVGKYIASGLNREAVPLAVANFGDNPAKVQAFVNGYTLLREMGFQSKSVGEALVMYDNDTDRALAYFLNNSS
ncbi:hypothetical protein UlMin_044053 [Ulmus minor]